MQPIFEKCPFKENDKLIKLFRLVLRGLNFPALSPGFRLLGEALLQVGGLAAWPTL
jgi:hypothetical protein